MEQEITIRASQEISETKKIAHLPVMLRKNKDHFQCNIAQAINASGTSAAESFQKAMAECLSRIGTTTKIYSLENKTKDLLSVEEEKTILASLLITDIDIS